MSEQRGYVSSNYLRITAKVTEHVKRRSYAVMDIGPGQKVLDVGCGPGTDTIPLARLVGDGGRVVGVDWGQEMIDEADRRAVEAGVDPTVMHKRGNATALPFDSGEFDSGEFDSCRSERLFQHLHNPEAALSEMVRVTKAGGWVVVVDTDWGTGLIDTPEVDIERRLMRAKTERCLNNGHSGRQLYRLFRTECLGSLVVEAFALPILSYPLAREIGQFDVIEREALSAGVVTAEELDLLRASLDQAEAEGTFFAMASMVMVGGRVPGR